MLQGLSGQPALSNKSVRQARKFQWTKELLCTELQATYQGVHRPASLSSLGFFLIPVFENNIRKTTLQFVSFCFHSTHQMSTEGFVCLFTFVFI